MHIYLNIDILSNIQYDVTINSSDDVTITMMQYTGSRAIKHSEMR